MTHSLHEKLRASGEETLLMLLTFLTGLGIWFTVPLVGSLPVAEASLGMAGLLLLWKAIRQRHWPELLSRTRLPRLFFALVAVALCAYVISDLVNHTSTTDLLRGWARISLLGIDLLFMVLLLGRDWNHLRLLLFGFLAGAVLAVLLDPEGRHNDLWKFGFAYPVSFLLPILIPERRRHLLFLCLTGLGIVHIFLQARSLGAICIITGCLLWLSALPVRLQRLGFIAGLALASLGIAWAYQGSEVAEKSRGSTMERSAMLSFAIEAFADSPLIGNGSWFTKSTRMDKFWRQRADVDHLSAAGEPEEVVIHSQLLTALAEAGFPGGLFFLVFGSMLAWGIYFAYRTRFPLRACVLLLLINALWDLLMSTFSGFERVFIALAAALLIVLWDLRRLQLENGA